MIENEAIYEKEGGTISTMDPIPDQKRRNLIPSYGRKRSHGLSKAQKSDIRELYGLYGIDLNTIAGTAAAIDPIDLFFSTLPLLPTKTVFIEIGFGEGEHLIQNAVQNPDVAFIGCEPFENGVVNALREIRDNNLKNVRVFNGDARFLLEKFKPESIDKFYILFPDPWPKQRYHKRRLVSESFLLDFIHPLLKKGGEIIIATDCKDYMKDILKAFEGNSSLDKFNIKYEHISEKLPSNDEIDSTIPNDFISTRYEQKALAKGLEPFYLRAAKTK